MLLRVDAHLVEEHRHRYEIGRRGVGVVEGKRFPTNVLRAEDVRFAQMHKGRMEVALKKDTNVANIVQQFERTQLHNLGGVAEYNGENYGGQQVASKS